MNNWKRLIIGTIVTLFWFFIFYTGYTEIITTYEMRIQTQYSILFLGSMLAAAIFFKIARFGIIRGNNRHKVHYKEKPDKNFQRWKKNYKG